MVSVQGGRMVLDLANGRTVTVGLEGARSVAMAFARRFSLPAPSITDTVEWDQWTTSEQFERDRPLYRFSFDDREHTQLYVSPVSGAALQLTTASIRFWNWLGAVPHWIYFWPLRRHGYIWAQVTIYTSLIGCFLTLTGLYIGVRQYRLRPARRASPYRGYMFWHHIPGIAFGIFLFTWVASGLLSMTPWGFLEGGGAEVERSLLAGRLQWQSVRGSLEHMGARPENALRVSLRSAPLGGSLFWIATSADGKRLRLNERGEPAPLSRLEWLLEARLLGGSSPPQLMSAEDTFYFEHHSEPMTLPVYRLVLPDAERTRYYLDPISGQILRKFDSNARGYRWLHEALHRLDFARALRTRPLWDVLMVSLLAGSALVCATGLYSAALRVSGRRGERM